MWKIALETVIWSKLWTEKIWSHISETGVEKEHACPDNKPWKFMGPPWGSPGSCRPQMGPMVAPYEPCYQACVHQWQMLAGSHQTRCRQSLWCECQSGISIKDCYAMFCFICVVNISYKHIERHTAHTIVSWPNPEQWVMVHTSDFMMIIRQSIYIPSIITRGMGKLKTHSLTYCIMDNWENMLNLTHTLDKIYLTNIL